MPFDKSLDKELFKEEIDFESTKIVVGVFSYNENEPKLQLIRENINAQGGTSFAKLGRMNKQEVEKVLPVIQKALEKM